MYTLSSERSFVFIDQSQIGYKLFSINRNIFTRIPCCVAHTCLQDVPIFFYGPIKSSMMKPIEPRPFLYSLPFLCFLRLTAFAE